MSTATQPPSLTAAEIARMLDGDLQGQGDRAIHSVEVLERATPGHLSYLGDAKSLQRLKNCMALVLLAADALRRQLEGLHDRTIIFVPEPEVAFLSIAALLNPRRSRPRIGVSPRACVDPTAKIGTNTNVHPLATIGQDVVIGHNCDIHSGVVIGDGCRIGDNVVVHPNTVLYHDLLIGSHVIIHAGCVIGCDGFGYRFVNGGHQRLPHFGTVRICDDVEIGAGTAIDRAKVGETVIGTGTRIDNMVMIGHNCHIGRHNILVAQVGIGGSSSTGDYVICAGQVGIADHVHVGDRAVLGAKAGIHRDMPGGQTYYGMPAQPAAETSRQFSALRRLPEIRDSVRRMEKELEQLRARLAMPSESTHDDLPDTAAA
jgi:UDP-3-O-[3-hydroxymyristoyl] glucosamine N-acyltransferase